MVYDLVYDQNPLHVPPPPPRDTVHEPDLRLGCRNSKHGNPLSQVVSANLTVMIKAGVGLCVHGLLQSRDSHR